jgi:hypothetical protein
MSIIKLIGAVNKILKALMISIFILLFLITILVIKGSISDHIDMRSEKFNSVLFKNEDINRATMVYDLIENYLHKGMKISQVEELLGKNYIIREYNSKSYKRNCFYYDLGLLGVYVYSEYKLIICPDKANNFLESYKILWMTAWNEYFDGGKNIYFDPSPSFIDLGD